MADFDPAKEAINLSKHGVSLARWVDLEILAIVGDDRFDYGEPRLSRLTDCWTASRIASFLRSATMRTGLSVCGAPMQRR